MKVGTPYEARFDSIVIYLMDEIAVKATLTEIGKFQHAGGKRFFEPGVSRMTREVHTVDGRPVIGVAHGDEPPSVTFHGGQKHRSLRVQAQSFGSFREELILAAMKSAGGDKQIFIQRVLKNFMAAGIDPRDPSIQLCKLDFETKARELEQGL